MSLIYDSELPEILQDELGVMYESIKSLGYKRYVETEIAIIKLMGATSDEINARLKLIKDNRKKLENIGVSIASTYTSPSLVNINTLLDQQLFKTKKPRKKGRFGAINEVPEPSGNARFKCNASLHNFDGTTKRHTIASRVGGTREDCEKEIYYKILEVLNKNLSIVGNDTLGKIDCYEYALEDLERFKTIVSSSSISTAVDCEIMNLRGHLVSFNPDDDISPWML